MSFKTVRTFRVLRCRGTQGYCNPCRLIHGTYTQSAIPLGWCGGGVFRVHLHRRRVGWSRVRLFIVIKRRQGQKKKKNNEIRHAACFFSLLVLFVRRPGRPLRSNFSTRLHNHNNCMKSSAGDQLYNNNMLGDYMYSSL